MPVPSAFQHAGFFVLRSPLLPFDALRTARCTSSDGLFARPAVREAVFVASPSLEEARARNGAAGTEGWHKLDRALLGYAARITGRATPFGLFAGGGVGWVGRSTSLVVAEPRRHTRLDMDYVVLLCDALANDPAIRPLLRFRPNSSLYRVAGHVRYHEIHRAEASWKHRRATIAMSPHLDAMLARAASGATLAELGRVLLEQDPGAEQADAACFVDELVAHQVLVSELMPAVTGAEPLDRLIGQLRRLPAGTATQILEWVRGELTALDAFGVGADPARYRAIALRLRELPAEVTPSRLFQVDLVRPAAPSLGENVIAEMARGVEVLRRTTPLRDDGPLDAFREAFMARFGDTACTRGVPLAEAIDEETGIGFAGGAVAIEASSLLEGIGVPTTEGRPVSWGTRESHLFALLARTQSAGTQELALTETDLQKLAVPGPRPLPDSFAVMGRLQATSDEAVARGDFRLFLAAASGPSGARLLGRFCHADPELDAHVRLYLREEEALRPDVVFAEIVHLPEGRIGNILVRPTCREYEIPYLGVSCAPEERQLPLSDLWVSVEEGRVVLRSARLGREIAPRLTTAHDFGSSSGVYGFLCALQEQGLAAALAWDWGPLLHAAFLPRITFGRLVLSRALWRVTADETRHLAGDDPSRRHAAVQEWRAGRRLPRWVCLADADHELPIDFDDPALVEMLLSRLRGRDHATLTELFPDPNALCATGRGGKHVHELLVPFVKRPELATPSDCRPSRGNSQHCRRTFAPGSAWLSIKLYAGSLTVDRLLRETVGPVAAELVRTGAASRWFFVRYADPHGHLRIRFAGDPALLWEVVLPRVRMVWAPFEESGIVWKVQLDTYEREIERYGGPDGIAACEEIFHCDSRTAVELLGLQPDDPRGDWRWRTALLGADRLLDDLGLDAEGKRTLLATWVHPARSGELEGAGAKYRAESASIAQLLNADAGGWQRERDAFARRAEAHAHAMAALRRADREGRLAPSLPQIAVSLVHMHFNRLLRSAHRLQERVLTELLHRHCESLTARMVQASPAHVRTQGLASRDEAR